MKRSTVMLVIAGLLGLTALTAFVIQRVSAPTVLRVAVGPVGSQDAKLVATILQFFAREKHAVRLRMVPTDGPVGSAEALRLGKADLALARSDGNLPPNAATVAILHRDAFMLMVPDGSPIREISDLRDKKIGISCGFSLNQRLADFVLQSYGIAPDQTTKIQLAPSDVRTAITSGQVDAVLVVGPPASPFIGQIYQELQNGDGAAPTILGIPAAEALVQRNPTVETMTVLKGTFGGAPLRPAKSIETLAVTHRLVVDRAMSEAVVTDLARSLFEIRQSVAAEFPNFAMVEAPDTEKLGPLVVHPGAAAYFDGETKTFIEQYGEWIYIVIMAVSLIGSALAALLSRQFANSRQPGSSEIDRMLLLLRQARSAKSAEDLDRIQNDADIVFGRTVERAAESEIEEAVLSAFTIALSELRTAVDERRRVLAVEVAGGGI